MLEKVGPVGFEPTDLALIANHLRNHYSPIRSPELREVVDCWDALPDALKTAILAIVRSAKPEGGAR